MSKILLIFMMLAPNFKGHDVALWLARSCVGEAGFDAADTGECTAIAHVYAKRVHISRIPYYKMIRKYSAAVSDQRRRPWINQLNRACARPKGFGKNLKWERYQERWKRTLDTADSFFRGELSDPTPTAKHYGGWIDRHNLDPRVWKRIPDTGFRNYFYEMRR